MYACTPVVEADYDGDRIPWEYALDVLAQEGETKGDRSYGASSSETSRR